MISERRACAALGQHRSTQRKIPRGREDEEQLTEDLVALVREHGRLGYRKMAALLRSTSGWVVNDKRVERIWRQEGLKVPPRQSKRCRIWPGDGACTRLRAERPNHVWSYDFVEDRTHDGRKYRMLNVVDEFTRECLSIRINRKLRSSDVIDVLSDLFILGARWSTSGRTTAPSSLRRRFKTGSPPSERRLPISSRGARGKGKGPPCSCEVEPMGNETPRSVSCNLSITVTIMNGAAIAVMR